MVIRDAEEPDLPAILEIINEAILNSTAIYEYDIKDMAYVQNWYQERKKDNFPIIVYELDNQIAAYCSYGTFRARRAYQYSVEHSIYVHKDFRGKGIGKKLLEVLIEKARQEGYHTMIGGIDTLNQGSMNFHRKMGFFEVARFKEVGYKFDKWLDIVFMQIML